MGDLGLLSEQVSEENLKRIIEMRHRVEDLTARLNDKPPPHGTTLELPDCTTCGRCCSAPDGATGYLVRVVPEDDVPPQMTMNGFSMLMHNVEGACRCTALAGLIDEQVTCTIYERRPAVCRGYLRGGSECLRRLVDVVMEQV
jgi:hypothetical protein